MRVLSYVTGLFLAASVLFAACGNEGGSAATETKTPETPEERRAALIGEIEAQESKVFSGKVDQLNPADASELLTLYKGFALANSNDSLTPEYLFKAGSVARGLGDYAEAVALYERLNKNYRAYERRQESFFILGLLHEQFLNQQGKARSYYEQVIKLDPTTRLAGDARASIENLELSPEELIEKFKEKNAKQDDASS